MFISFSFFSSNSFKLVKLIEFTTLCHFSSIFQVKFKNSILCVFVRNLSHKFNIWSTLFSLTTIGVVLNFKLNRIRHFFKIIQLSKRITALEDFIFVDIRYFISSLLNFSIEIFTILMFSHYFLIFLVMSRSSFKHVQQLVKLSYDLAIVEEVKENRFKSIKFLLVFPSNVPFKIISEIVFVIFNGNISNGIRIVLI